MASTWRFVLLIFLIGELAVALGESEEICYDDPGCGPSTWGGMCNTGKQQSPIDLPLHHGFFEPVKFTVKGDWTPSKFYGQNIGHTVEFNFNPDKDNLKSEMVISGGKLPGKYKLGLFHFHWGKDDSEGSEHTVNGKSYPLELHLIYYCSTYATYNEAFKSTDDRYAIANMGMFFKIGGKNSALTPIIQALKDLQEQGGIKEFNKKLKIPEFYPKILEFAQYKGSFTTPPCNQNVLRIAFTHPLSISKSQMEEFRKLKNAKGQPISYNFRQTQPLNSRKINYYTGNKL